MKHTSNWERRETNGLLQSSDVTHGDIWGNNDGVVDETVLELLHLSHHLSLLIGRAVVVNNTDTTQESHVDSHVLLSDGIHRGRQEGALHGDLLGQFRLQLHLRSREVDQAW